MKAKTYFNRGLKKAQCNDYRGAIVDYDKAIKLNPKNGNMYFFRAIVKNHIGDRKGATADLNKKELLERRAYGN